MQLYVGRQLLDSVSLDRAPGAAEERIGGRSKKMGFGAQASESVVDEYMCLQGAGKHGDHDGGRGTQVTACEQVQDSGFLLPPELEDAGAKCQQSLMEGTSRSTEARTCCGR